MLDTVTTGLPRRLQGLVGIAGIDAAAMMARDRIELLTAPDLPRQAEIVTALAAIGALEGEQALMDRLRLLAHALPRHAAVRWACHAARRMLEIRGPAARPSPTLEAAEAWVRTPDAAHRQAAEQAARDARPSDDCDLCASAVLFADGTMGPGLLDEYPDPPGAFGTMVWGMLMNAMTADPDRFHEIGEALFDHGLDLARENRGAEKTATGPRQQTAATAD